MPLYVYEIVLPDGSGGAQFEFIQRMSADALTKHPETGEPVRRVFGEPNTPRAWTDAQGKTHCMALLRMLIEVPDDYELQNVGRAGATKSGGEL